MYDRSPLFQPTSNGGECQPGEYCPVGSPAPIPCTAGKFCNSSGLAIPVADCDPGWYCPTGSSSPRQVQCPQGYFCPVGSDLPEPCRNGTYGAAIKLTAQSECEACDPGHYCNETAATTVSGVCHAGQSLFAFRRSCGFPWFLQIMKNHSDFKVNFQACRIMELLLELSWNFKMVFYFS